MNRCDTFRGTVAVLAAPRLDPQSDGRRPGLGREGYVTVHRRRPGLQIGRRPAVGDHQIVDQELGRGPSP